MLKWPGQIAVHSAKRPVAKYTREEGKSREEFHGKRRIMRDLKSRTRFSEGSFRLCLRISTVPSFDRVSPCFLLESKMNRSREGWTYRFCLRISLDVFARLIGREINGVANGYASCYEIKNIAQHDVLAVLLLYAFATILQFSKSHLSKFPFFSHFFFSVPLPLLPPRTRINIRHSNSSPATKGTSFLEPGQFDFASKSKQAIGGMLKT